MVVGGSAGIVGRGQFTGNVGIGVAPHARYKLDVNGTLNATSILVNNTAISGSKWTGTTNIYYNGGNVAIGTTDATTYKLNVNGTSFFNGVMNFNQAYNGGGAEFACNTINLWGTGGSYGFGISGSTLDYFASSTYRWLYGGGGTNFGNNAMTITDNNLYVYGSVNCASLHSRSTIQSLGAFYFASGLWHKCNAGNDRFHFSPNATTYIKGGTTLGRVTTFRNGGDQDIGYFDDFYFYCYGPGNLSDRRIKRDIEEINDETTLNMLLLVQPTTYYYRDEARNKGNGKVYGFIAQQIKEVIPDTVMMTKDIIANIYKTCLIYNKREIYHSIPQDIDADEAFVFGYCVNDLHGLDKTYIYTLNVCTTQELHRHIKSQDEHIKELETKVERLLNYISL